MAIRTIKVSLAAIVVAAASSMAGCGSSDSGSSGASFSDLQAAVDSPTGTVSATSVGPVATEFENAVNNSVMAGMQEEPGRSAQATTDMSSEICTAGGSAKSEGSGSQSGGSGHVTYDSCCMAGSCCIDGTEDFAYNSDSSGTSTYNYCLEYDLSVNCDGSIVSASFSGCLDSMGQMVYSITVAGETFSVSGYYSNGNGELTITGANGTWDCTYTNDTGTCTGTGGDFTF